jgi:acyl-CoA thioesterase-2
MAASFQVREAGLEHQVPMPAVPGPEGLEDIEALARASGQELPERMRRFLTYRRPFTVRPVEPEQLFVNRKMEPVKHVWMKSMDALPADDFLHEILLAYVSDYELIGTATLPHGMHARRGGLQMASLDHAMWFHRPVRVDDWLLFALTSPNASGARGFSQGHVFTRDGVLVATLAQEGLIRVRQPA